MRPSAELDENGFSTTEAASAIRGSGEMAARIRAYAWHATQLGPIDRWPPELLAMVNMMLASREIGTVFWGPDRLLIYNDQYKVQLGERHPAALGSSLGEVWPEVVSAIAPLIAAAFDQGEATYLDESSITVLEGGVETERFYTASFEPIWVRSARAMSVQGVFQTAINNTDKVLAKRRLQASEAESARLLQQLNTIQNATTDSILAIDRNWVVTYLNGPARAATGPLADAVGKNFWEQYPDTVYEGSPYVAHYHRAMEEGIAGAFESYYPAPLDIWVEVRANPTPEGIVLFFRNVTDRKKEEALLQATSDRLHLAQLAGQISVWDWDLASGYVTWTESQWTWGRAPEELDSEAKCFAFVHPEDLDRLRRTLLPAIEGVSEYQCEFRVLWPDGNYRWVGAKGHSSLPDATGKPARILGVNADITERKLAEAALMQNEKLAAVGRLASSIAHEINNPLESVTNLIYLARSSAETGSEARHYLEMADRELRRISSITSQTLRFHKQSTKPTWVRGQDLIRETLSIYQGRIVNARIEIEERYRSENRVECFEGEIRQVLSNLISNAIDAMPEGGRLLLRSREATCLKTGDKGITLTVADTGTGMPEAIVRRVFDAFYSTKGIGGTGLGLWVSAEIIARHHGKLRVRSSQRTELRGTVFNLFLPFHAVGR